jgi:hypothetical protein
MKFEIYSTKLGYWDNTLLVEYPQLKEFDITRKEGNIVQYYITISSLEELEKLGKLLDEKLIIKFESFEIEIYDYYRE